MEGKKEGRAEGVSWLLHAFVFFGFSGFELWELLALGLWLLWFHCVSDVAWHGLVLACLDIQQSTKNQNKSNNKQRQQKCYLTWGTCEKVLARHYCKTLRRSCLDDRATQEDMPQPAATSPNVARDAACLIGLTNN